MDLFSFCQNITFYTQFLLFCVFPQADVILTMVVENISFMLLGKATVSNSLLELVEGWIKGMYIKKI